MDPKSKRKELEKRMTQQDNDWCGTYVGPKWDTNIDAFKAWLDEYKGTYNTNVGTQTDPWRPWDTMTHKRKFSYEETDSELTSCSGWTDPSACSSTSNKHDFGTQTLGKRSTRDGKQGDINSKIVKWADLAKRTYTKGNCTKEEMQKEVDFARGLMEKK